MPPSDHIQSETLFQTRQDQEKGINGSANLLHSWRWVLFVNLIWLTYWCFVDRWNRDSFRQDLQAWLLFRQVWQCGHRCEMWLICLWSKCWSSRSEPDAEDLKAYWEILKAEKNRKHEDYDDAPSRFATIPPMHQELRWRDRSFPNLQLKRVQLDMTELFLFICMLEQCNYESIIYFLSKAHNLTCT